MKFRKQCELEAFYGHTHPIVSDSPEYLFMQEVCKGNTDAAAAFFSEDKQFAKVKSAVDTPWKRYEGLEGIRAFIADFNPKFKAESSAIVPIIQTIGGGRVALEAVVNFVVDGQINQVPFFMVADKRTQDTLEELRIYTHFTFVPDQQAYRKPIYTSAYKEVTDVTLLTGAVREYFDAIHHWPSTDVERIMNCSSPDCIFGGYGPWTESGVPTQVHQDMLSTYEHIKTYIPRCVAMRIETITDDGVNCVIEWQHIISRAGREDLNRIATAGVSSYERGKDGKLCSIRICDYSNYEYTIDWSKTPLTKAEAQEINFVETFPPHVGCKSLEKPF